MNTPREADIHSLTLKSRHDDVEKLHNFLRAVAHDFFGDHVNQELVGSVILSVHEVFTNIVRHAYPDGTDDEVVFRCIPTQKGVVIEVVDHGVEFNPLENARELDTTIIDQLENVNDLLDLDESQILGGYGIPIIQAAATSTKYRRSESGENHLYMYFKKPQ